MINGWQLLINCKGHFSTRYLIRLLQCVILVNANTTQQHKCHQLIFYIVHKWATMIMYIRDKTSKHYCNRNSAELIYDGSRPNSRDLILYWCMTQGNTIREILIINQLVLIYEIQAEVKATVCNTVQYYNMIHLQHNVNLCAACHVSINDCFQHWQQWKCLKLKLVPLSCRNHLDVAILICLKVRKGATVILLEFINNFAERKNEPSDDDNVVGQKLNYVFVINEYHFDDIEMSN